MDESVIPSEPLSADEVRACLRFYADDLREILDGLYTINGVEKDPNAFSDAPFPHAVGPISRDELRAFLIYYTYGFQDIKDRVRTLIKTVSEIKKALKRLSAGGTPD